MGNQNGQGFDHSKQSGLYIRTEKPFYFAGEEVKGNIYLNVGGGAFPSSTIYLKVKGSEKAKWSETKTVWETIPGTNPPQRQSKQVTEHYDNENEFYQHKIPVYIFQQGMIPQGQYTFPFGFKLKENLPGSFEYSEKDLECRIRYSVKAEIDSPNKSLDKIKYKQEFLVREPIKEIVNQTEGQQVLQPTSCCCIPLGTIFFKFQFDKTAYQPGDIAQLQVEIDNSQSKVAIPTITGRLTNTLRIVSKQGHFRLIHRVCGNSMIPGLQPGQSAMNEQRKNMTLTLMDQHKHKPLDPTTNGKVVMNNYQLSATGELDGICLCCTQTPGIEFPIRIVAKPLPSYDQPVVAPSGWNPQVMNPVSVQFDDSYKYQPATGGVLLPAQNQNPQGYQNPNQPYYG
ncbi:unnamed protein product [Paramecium sonneborni]|uniref:Arrestin C-terminal-like domain-containing protein n=1 Tax=Paramecium sonneborni TaxID=65129 RepID=A0A8S1LI75_9CILI|nr:unnamed protein product [Paramecium sonneborni]